MDFCNTLNLRVYARLVEDAGCSLVVLFQVLDDVLGVIEEQEFAMEVNEATDCTQFVNEVMTFQSHTSGALMTCTDAGPCTVSAVP